MSQLLDTISSIGRLMGQRFGISPSESTRHIFQRLSISLWRGNATDPPQPITCTLRGRNCLNCPFVLNGEHTNIHQSHSQNDSGDLRGVAGGNGELGCLCGKAGTSHLCDGSAHSSGCVVNAMAAV